MNNSEKLKNYFHYPATIMFQADGEEYKFGREPTLRRMPDDSLISLVYSGGPREPSNENFVAIIRSYDDGETWSKPEKTFDSTTHAVWGTEIFTETEEPFAIIHTFHQETHYQELNAYRSFTSDSGKTWSAPEGFPGIPQCMSIRQGKVLSNGDWVFPVYWVENQPEKKLTSSSHQLSSHGKFVSGIIRSTDKGKSFSIHGYLHAPGKGAAWEPEVTELENGHLRMFIRYDKTKTLLSSESFDYGKTWTKAAPVQIPNPGAKITLYKVKDSHILFTNICEENKSPHRQRLEAWVSNDNLQSWNKKVLLSENPDPPEPLKSVTYPHGFADEKKGIFYLAVDSMKLFTLLKIPLEELI